jgi:hypothetical protein
MKALASGILLSLSILATSAALAADPAKKTALGADLGERPIGVEAQDWIPISDKLGFVVVSTIRDSKVHYEGPPPGERTRPLFSGVMPPPPAVGYFMAKTSEGWRRLVVMPAADLAAAG